MDIVFSVSFYKILLLAVFDLLSACLFLSASSPTNGEKQSGKDCFRSTPFSKSKCTAKCSKRNGAPGFVPLIKSVVLLPLHFF